MKNTTFVIINNKKNFEAKIKSFLTLEKFIFSFKTISEANSYFSSKNYDNEHSNSFILIDMNQLEDKNQTKYFIDVFQFIKICETSFVNKNSCVACTFEEFNGINEFDESNPDKNFLELDNLNLIKEVRKLNRSHDDFEIDGLKLFPVFYFSSLVDILKYFNCQNIEDFKAIPIQKISATLFDSNRNIHRKGVLFLDRDGVINVDKEYLYKFEDVSFYDGIFPIIKWANRNNFLVFVVSNQSGVERNYFTNSDVEKLHQQMDDYLKKQGVKITAWHYSPHHKKIQSITRKPHAGMPLIATENYFIDWQNTFMIGDKISDAFTNLPTVKTFFIKRQYDLSRVADKNTICESYDDLFEKFTHAGLGTFFNFF